MVSTKTEKNSAGAVMTAIEETSHAPVPPNPVQDPFQRLSTPLHLRTPCVAPEPRAAAWPAVTSAE